MEVGRKGIGCGPGAVRGAVRGSGGGGVGVPPGTMGDNGRAGGTMGGPGGQCPPSPANPAARHFRAQATALLGLSLPPAMWGSSPNGGLSFLSRHHGKNEEGSQHQNTPDKLPDLVQWVPNVGPRKAANMTC